MIIDSLPAEMNSSLSDWSPGATGPANGRKKGRLDPFPQSQRGNLLRLREEMVESMAGVAQDSRSSPIEASALGTHQADAGSDVYDRDFTLGLLAHEQNALYEIDQALQRIELGTYGICEMSGQPIPRSRLEAVPFARCTVTCQSRLEKKMKILGLSHRRRSPRALMNSKGEKDPPSRGVAV